MKLPDGDRLRGAAGERSGQLLREARAGAERHAPRPGAGEDRRHQLSRVPAARDAAAVEGRPRPAAGARARIADEGDRRAEAAARHAGPDGHEAHPGCERRAHHYYRGKPAGEDEEGALKGDDRKEAGRNGEAARVWIAGVEAVQRKLGLQRVIDLSARPFFLRGSGYREGTLFPWTGSDFSVMDAMASGT